MVPPKESLRYCSTERDPFPTPVAELSATAMFSRTSSHSQHSHPPNTPEASRDHGLHYGMARRQMAPPTLNYLPQPVEIDPVSYTRTPGSYPPWDLVLPTNSAVETHSSFPSTISINKTGNMAFEFPPRNSSQDGLANWFSSYDGPWVPRGAVPEVPSEDRPHARGCPPSPWRGSGYGPQFGLPNRPGNPSDSGSVPFGVLQSDSGYGTAPSLESASARGSDVADHAMEMRSLTDRIPEMHPYSENGPLREPHDVYGWPLTSPNGSQYRCETCQKFVKTKSELKKHHLRHTKPYHCKNQNCSRTEGFSTINDVERHMKSKHPNDCPEELLLKTYHCLVDGCKSKDKKWPRLDNFRSHLKRMHDLSEEQVENYVRRADLDRKPVQPQGTPIEIHRMDLRATPSMEVTDDPELPCHNDPTQWSHVSSTEISRQTKMIDPILQDDDTQILGPPNRDSHLGKDNDEGKPGSIEIHRASREPDAGDGCLRTEPKAQSTHSSGENLTSPSENSRGSFTGSLETKESHVRGKLPKSKRASKLDPCLREAITAVFSKATIGNDAGSDQELKLPLETVMSDTVHAYGTSPKGMDSEMSIPSLGEPSGGNLDGGAPCSGASSTLEPENKDLVDQEQKIQEFLKAIQAAGYVLKKDTKSTGLGHTVDQLGSGPNKKRDQESCPLCTKFRGRPCEVKKHMKRHDRPYGCTFPGCQKSFGSKNDWKRHENSQHYQHETWRCDEENNGKPCGKVFYTADSVRNHFTKTHKVEEPEILERKIAARRIGPNHQKQFWCGFCVKLIDLSQKGVDAWTERFNHIDDHFMGRNNQPKQSITQWKPAVEDEEGLSVSAKPFSPNGDEDRTSSDDSQPSSPDNPSASSAQSAEVTSSDDAGQAVPEQQKAKRKRPNDDGHEERVSKQSKSGKAEIRIICCQCLSDFNPKTDTACYNDDHVFCNLCTRRPVEQFRDST